MPSHTHHSAQPAPKHRPPTMDQWEELRKQSRPKRSIWRRFAERAAMKEK